MPLYEYECTKCAHRFEKIEKMDAPHRQKCPKCRAKAEQLLTAPAIQFKGGGWYVTDYGRKTPSQSSSGQAGGDSKLEKPEKAAGDSKESKDTKEKAEKKEPSKKDHKHK